MAVSLIVLNEPGAYNFPQLPYTRSLATLVGVVGQMYVAIIIAMLVGKYSSSGQADGP